jgi:hypothetical protein
MNEVIEWAEFTLKPGVSEQALLQGSDALERDFLAGTQGYLRRELLKLGEGHYADLVWWSSRADAERAMEHAMTSAVCATYFSLMATNADGAGDGVKHFSLLERYGRAVATAA